MPHFYARKIDSPKYPMFGEKFAFLWEARNIKDGSAVILCEMRESRAESWHFEAEAEKSKNLGVFGKVLSGDIKGCASERAKIELKVHYSEANEASPLKSPTRRSKMTHPLTPSAREGESLDSLGVAQTHLLLQSKSKQKIVATKLHFESVVGGGGEVERGRGATSQFKPPPPLAKMRARGDSSESGNWRNPDSKSEVSSNSREAQNFRDISHLHDYINPPKPRILLTKIHKDGKILLKCNKHLKATSTNAIKSALSEYARLTNAEIIAHNLSGNKIEAKPKFLLESREILPFFKNHTAPKVLEIGFGSGRHILNLAKTHKDTIFIGLEIYRPAILQVLRQIELLNLTNLFLLNCDSRGFCEILPRESLQKIFLHFPVPWEKSPQRRVFSANFLQNAMRTLKHGGFLEIRTDSGEYFAYATDLSRHHRTESAINEAESTISKYEARWQRQKKDIFTLRIFAPDSHKSRESWRKSQESLEINDSLKSKDSPESPNLNSTKSLNIARILALPKICKEEYFLHVKNIYEVGDSRDSCHDSNDSKDSNDSHESKDSHDSHHKRDSSDSRESRPKYLLLVAFGAYYAPCSGFVAVGENGANVAFLGDFIPTKCNVGALNLLWSF